MKKPQREEVTDLNADKKKKNLNTKIKRAKL